MPLFYFDVTDGDFIPDLIGTELPDMDAARTHAISLCGELLNAKTTKFWKGEEWLIEVRDDCGLGLFTLYSHLSSIDVKEGDTVKQRQALGRTGQTGLAAGDHLHYGVYLHGVAVLPVEWWDAKWIKDNIEPKLEGMSGNEIAEMQAPRKTTRKRRR